jgi:hypothetical protein
VAFHESQPGIRAVWLALRITDDFVAEGEATNRELAAQVEAVLEKKLRIPKKKRVAMATMVVEVMTTLLIILARRPDEGKVLVREAKELLERYFSPYER